MRTFPLLAVATLLSVGACGGDASFTASGSLGIVAPNSTTSDCASGTGGYSDIREGASVVVSDASGKKLATGSLDAGHFYKGSSGLCLFDFAVEGVPGGQGPYSVEIANRGDVVFNEEKADGITVSLGG